MAGGGGDPEMAEVPGAGAIVVQEDPGADGDEKPARHRGAAPVGAAEPKRRRTDLEGKAAAAAAPQPAAASVRLKNASVSSKGAGRTKMIDIQGDGDCGFQALAVAVAAASADLRSGGRTDYDILKEKAARRGYTMRMKMGRRDLADRVAAEPPRHHGVGGRRGAADDSRLPQGLRAQEQVPRLAHAPLLGRRHQPRHPVVGTAGAKVGAMRQSNRDGGRGGSGR